MSVCCAFEANRISVGREGQKIFIGEDALPSRVSATSVYLRGFPVHAYFSDHFRVATCIADTDQWWLNSLGMIFTQTSSLAVVVERISN